MQRVTLICVGKLKEKFYQEAAAEYVTQAAFDSWYDSFCGALSAAAGR